MAQITKCDKCHREIPDLKEICYLKIGTGNPDIVSFDYKVPKTFELCTNCFTELKAKWLEWCNMGN